MVGVVLDYLVVCHRLYIDTGWHGKCGDLRLNQVMDIPIVTVLFVGLVVTGVGPGVGLDSRFGFHNLSSSSISDTVGLSVVAGSIVDIRRRLCVIGVRNCWGRLERRCTRHTQKAFRTHSRPDEGGMLAIRWAR